MGDLTAEGGVTYITTQRSIYGSIHTKYRIL